MRRFPAVLMFAVVALAIALPAEAQFARSQLSGVVTDPDGAPLPGVTVVARNQANGSLRTVTSGPRGGYLFQGMTPGMYTVSFSMSGFRTVEQPDVQLSVGQQPVLNMAMELGAVEETLTVTAQSPMVEVASKEVGGSLTTNEIENLPSVNRSFIMFASLLPGVSAALGTTTTSSDVIFVNGQDDTNNQFNIDGAANDDDFNGGNAGGQVRAAFEAMEEFQILTSQFDAEFGRTQGAVVNAVTKSGSNEFHGVGFFYAQNQDWNQTPYFTERAGEPNPPQKFTGLGFTVGGPIIRDQTHFFFSYERLTPDRGNTNNFDNIGYPEFTFTFTEDNLVNNIVGKVDHQMSANHKLSVRYLWEHSPQFRQFDGEASDPDLLGEEDDYDTQLAGSVDSVISDTIFNNLRISWTKEDVTFANPYFNECGKTFACLRTAPPVESHPDIFFGSSSRASSRLNNSYQFDNTLSWYVPDAKGDHDIRIGGNFSYRTVEPLSPSNAQGTFSFPENTRFDVNNPATYPENFGVRLFDALGVGDTRAPDPKVVGLFVQDDWQPIPNLTLNLGVRYDAETITYDYNNLAPRLGLSYDPMGDGKTILRAGYGRFYDRTITGVFDNFWRDSVFQLVGINDSWAGEPGGNDCVQCFVDLFEEQGFSNLTQARDYLINLLESLAEDSFNANPTVDHPDRRTPFADTFSAGFEREVMDNVSASFDYVRTHNKDILLRVVLNEEDEATGQRPNISILNGVVDDDLRDIGTYINGNASGSGEAVNNSFQFQLRKRYSDTRFGRVSGRLAYTYTRQYGNFVNDNRGSTVSYWLPSQTGWNFDQPGSSNDSGFTGSPIGEDFVLDLDDPQNANRPLNNDRVHLFNLSGSWQIPGTSWQDNGGIIVSGIYRYWTGQPFTVVDASARHPHSNIRLPAPAGSYSANQPGDQCAVPCDDIALQNVESTGTENGARQPNLSVLDVSFRYDIPILDRYEAQILVDIFNLFNTVNFDGVGGTRTDLNSFLIPDDTETPLRGFQFGIKFTY